VTARERLAALLAPDVLAALEELVSERVAEAVAAMPSGSPPWLSLDEAAAHLRVSPRSVERAINRGRLRSSTVGRRRIVHRDDLDELATAATGEDVAPTTPPRRHTRRLERPTEQA
jgi:excisionase family DNA binding protein